MGSQLQRLQKAAEAFTAAVTGLVTADVGQLGSATCLDLGLAGCPPPFFGVKVGADRFSGVCLQIGGWDSVVVGGTGAASTLLRV